MSCGLSKTRLHAGPRYRAGVVIQARACADARIRCAERRAIAGGHDRHGCTTARRRRDRKRAVRARDHAPMMLACAHAMPRTELLPADPPAWRGLRRRTRRRPARAPLRGAARRSRVLGPAVQRGQPRGHCRRRKPERCSARRLLPCFVRGIARPPELGDRAPRCEHDRRDRKSVV